MYPEKVICQKRLQASSIEEDKLQLCTLLMFITFLLANFLHFSKVFSVIEAFFETLKPNGAQNFDKRVLQKCLSEPLSFSKKTIIIAVLA